MTTLTICVSICLKTTTFPYKIKWNLYFYSQTLTLFFKTYTIYPSNVPVLFRWHQLRFYEQPYNISVTISCSPREWISLQNILITFTINLLTYPSFVDISSILYEQSYNISVTIFCSLREWSVLQNIEKKNNEKV